MIDLDIRENIARITLNAPQKMNALGPEDIAALSAAYDTAAEAGVRALLLRAEGRGFCAGRDISGVDPREDDVPGYLAGLVEPLLAKMSAFPAPTFAAAQGASLGVGLGLLIATDVVFVATNAKIGSPFRNLGATLDCGGHALFFERLGAHRTLDIIYSGSLISGEEAVRGGLFSRALPLEDLERVTEEAVMIAATGPTQAFLASKRIIAGLRDERLGFWRSMAQENQAQAALSEGPDYREGFLAFQEKRAATFTGRPA